MASLPYPRTPLSPRLPLSFFRFTLFFSLFTPSLFLFILPTFVIRIDRRGCSYRPTRMLASTDADARIDRRRWFLLMFRSVKPLLSQCQTFTFVLPNRCFCSSRPPFLHFIPSFSFHIFPRFPQSAVLSCCVHPLVAVLKTVSLAYNNIMCASTMRCFNCKQLLKRTRIFNFSLQKFWRFTKKLYLCIRFRIATVSQANVRDMERNRKRTETRVLWKDLHKTEVVQEARMMNNRSWVEEKRTVKFVWL